MLAWRLKQCDGLFPYNTALTRYVAGHLHLIVYRLFML